MAQDITTVQRDLANLQKQSKQLSDKIKNESDPNRKAILQKKLIDLNTKKANLNKEMEDIVTSIGAGQELEFAEGFTKWNKYKKSKVKKLTESEKLKIKNFAKGLVEKKVIKEDQFDDYTKCEVLREEILEYWDKICIAISKKYMKKYMKVAKEAGLDPDEGWYDITNDFVYNA